MDNAEEIIKQVDALMKKALIDVVINLTNLKYKKDTIITVLAWGERNPKIYHRLMKKHQPQYYVDGWDFPINSFTLKADLDNDFKPIPSFIKKEFEQKDLTERLKIKK